MDLQGFFGMQHLLPGKAVLRVAHPETRIGDDQRQGGQGLQRRLFVDVGQLFRINRVGTDADRQRVKDGVFHAIGLGLLVDDRANQGCVIFHKCPL